MNILMIAYYYPPMGGGGVQRTLKFVKYLSKLGHKVHVLTVKNDELSTEFAIKGLVDENIMVYRSDIKEIKILNRINNISSNSHLHSQKSVRTSKIVRVIRNTVKKLILNLYNMKYVPDDKCGWIDFAVIEGKKIIKNNKIDVVYSTSSPYTAHLIGYEIAKATNIKWIADFRDPWAANKFSDFNYIVRKKHFKLEAKVVKRADSVLSVSQPIINDFIARYKQENKKKFVLIPNGYDEEDFEALKLNISDSNERFTILYNGMIYGNRSPEKILKAIDNLIKKNKIDINKLEIIFQGQVGKEHLGVINYYIDMYPGIVKHKNQVNHEESLLEICRANALLLIIDEGPGSEGIYTGKIFEYIRSGKIILGIIPDGVAKKLIIDTGTGFTAYPSRIDEIEGIILKAYMIFVNKDKRFSPHYDKIEKYNRENLTKKLLDVIESQGEN